MFTIPFISIIIPCLNEKHFIGKCLDSVIANDYPKDKMEVLVVDGISEDGTRSILEKYIHYYPFIKMLDNIKKITPAALNVGIRAAKGEIIIRLDAHAAYKEDYFSKCVKYLNEYKADNVGGIWITVPRDNSLFAKAVKLCLSHTFGVGNAHYKTGLTNSPKWVDTVPFGCFHKNIFDKIGLFDETRPRNEDIEFNTRLKAIGGKILLVPEIVVYYYARSTFREFCKHIFSNGTTITYHFDWGKKIFKWRHLTPFFFVTSLIFSIFLIFISSLVGFSNTLGIWMFLLTFGSYLIVNVFFSSQISLRENDLRCLFILPITFFSLHFCYGLGSIWGIVKVVRQ